MRGHEIDVFLSYAHIDDEPLAEGDTGWVTDFRNALDACLGQLLGHRVSIWMDQNLVPGSGFDDAIYEAVSEAGVFVAVLSPAYLNSEYCQQEVRGFVEGSESSGGVVIENKSRIFKAVKAPVDDPPPFDNLLGYQFFKPTSDGHHVELSLSGDSKPAFFDVVNDLARDIAKMLDMLRSTSPRAAEPEIQLDTRPTEPEAPKSAVEGNDPSDLPLHASSQAEALAATVDPDEEASDEPPLDTLAGREPWMDASPVAGYTADRVDPDAPDRLGIEAEVRTLCQVLVSRTVTPPLSLGLFGDWGSGKSFFMAKMRKEIDDIAFTARDQRVPGFCTSVAQIEFNAWHFSDSNLWASLVSHIFDELFEKLSGANSDASIEGKLKEELSRANGLVQEATQTLQNAKGSVDSAEDALREVRREREEKERTLDGLVNDVKALLKDDETVHDALTQAGAALGYPEADSTYAALQETAGDLRSFSKRAAAIGQAFIEAPFSATAIPLLAVVLIVSFGVGVLLERPGGIAGITGVTARIGEIGAFVTGIAVWVGTQMRRVSPAIKTIEDAYQRTRDERDRRQREEVAPQQRELKLAQEREEVARQALIEAQVALKNAEHSLGDFTPGRRLYRLIEERGGGDSYSQHLGIISLIRKDFERMSSLLNELADRGHEDDEEPPLERIVLYIDDLDRCPANRVVEILEAIHLLLAFPLFVVVVGVDPRWLRRCLELHHQSLFSNSRETAEAEDADAASMRTSTPQDYLEKIFQIPFALRPIGPDGYRQYIEDLLTTVEGTPRVEEVVRDREAVRDDEDGRVEAAAPPGKALRGEEVTHDATKEVPVPPALGESANGSVDPREKGTESPNPTPVTLDTGAAGREQARVPERGRQGGLVPLNPRQLDFTDNERRDIKRLAPLFRTPRAVKRFINIYRLVRVGLAEEERSAFDGTEGDVGNYRAALTLLAVVTAYPNLAPQFLQRFTWWLPKPWEQRPDSSWDDFLTTLELPRHAIEPLFESSSDWSEIARHVGQGRAEVEVPDAVWKKFCDNLRAVAGRRDEASFLPFDEEVLTTWALRVARYSFSFDLHESFDERGPEDRAFT